MSTIREPEVPICPCSDPGTTHTVAAHWVKAEPMKGPLVFARDDSPAMSTDPTAEHTDAVERWKPEPAHPRPRCMAPLRSGGQCRAFAMSGLDHCHRHGDKTAVHAALAASLPAEVMLAALVDRGTLHRLNEWVPGRVAKARMRRRFVTEWEDVAP